MPAANKPSLDTLGEIFRFAVRRFGAARLAYGHGTTNARDEAAFLVLEALRLPIDRLEPYLDLKPTAAERARLLTLIDARVSLRLPAPYLVGTAYMHGVRFQADRRALALAALRSSPPSPFPTRASTPRICRQARSPWRGATWRRIGWATASRFIAAISSGRSVAGATTSSSATRPMSMRAAWRVCRRNTVTSRAWPWPPATTVSTWCAASCKRRRDT